MAETTAHIALVCPGGPITKGLADRVGGIAAIELAGRVQLHFHPQCFLETGHFAGSGEERSAAFLEVANDPKYAALWFARGGYGACRLDDALYGELNDAARAKTYLGYSDAGLILAHLYKEGIGRPVHGPMPTDLGRAGGENAIKRALHFLAGDNGSSLEPASAAGKKTIAFNITVLGSFINTAWAPDLSGHVVMLEDIGEYLYRIDRSLFTIMTSRNMKDAEGVMLGRISDITENDRPFGATEEEMVKYWCERLGVPYLGRADIGHDAENKIVPFGVTSG